MNVLKRLALKNLKMNKKRTISTIIGIVLSTALICGTATLISSVQKTLIQNAINETGYYHLSLGDIRENELKDIKANRDIDNIFEVERVGYGKLDGLQNEGKPYLKLYSMSNEGLQNLNFKLTQGRFAMNKNEIVISKHIKHNGGLVLKIGDKINIDIGKRQTLDGHELRRKQPI